MARAVYQKIQNLRNNVLGEVIDLEVPLSDTLGFDVNINGLSRYNNDIIGFGAKKVETDTGIYYRNYYYKQGGNYKRYIRFGNTNVADSSSYVSMPSSSEFKIVNNANATSITITAFSKTQTRTKAQTGTFNYPDISLYVFGLHAKSETEDYLETQHTGYVYYIKITDNGVLIRDMIPVKRLSDGICGLFDKVSKKFFIAKSGNTSCFTGTTQEVYYDSQGNELASKTDLISQLNYINQTKELMRQALINKDLQVSTDDTFRDYVDKINDIQVGAKKNIFIQSSEPEIKDGFWFKNSEEIKLKKTIAKKYFTDFIVGNGEWKGPEEYVTPPYPGSLGWECAKVGNFIYLFGTDEQPNQAYKYDYINDVFTKLPDTPQISQRCMVSAVGTDIYIIAGGANSQSVNTIYKFDTLTETYTLCQAQLSTITSLGSSVAVGTDIYIFGGYAGKTIDPSKYAYKYDTLTDTLTRLADIPYKYAYHRCIEYNGDIFLFGGMYNSKLVLKYNIATDTYTYLGDNCAIPFEFKLGIVERIGNKAYIFLDTNACVFDLDNYTYEILDNPSYITMHFASSLVFKKTNYKILIFGGAQIVSYDFPLEILTDNSLILSTNGSNKSTQLYNDEKLDGNLPIHFENVGLYTNENGYLLDLKRYYGDGTKWIEIN